MNKPNEQISDHPHEFTSDGGRCLTCCKTAAELMAEQPKPSKATPLVEQIADECFDNISSFIPEWRDNLEPKKWIRHFICAAVEKATDDAYNEGWKSACREAVAPKAAQPQRSETYCHHCDGWHSGKHISLDHHEGEPVSGAVSGEPQEQWTPEYVKKLRQKATDKRNNPLDGDAAIADSHNAALAAEREALGCAEYALTHPESDQQFALAAVRDAIGKADAAIAQAKENRHDSAT